MESVGGAECVGVQETEDKETSRFSNPPPEAGGVAVLCG
jgi:hypothetical protein